MTPSAALIIDDDPLSQILAEEALRAIGVGKILTANDGSAGLKLIETAPKSFDLILCDLQMPELDGVGVIRELNQLGFDGALIIISGENADIIRTVGTMARMLGVRALGTLTKPISETDIRQLLNMANESSVAEPFQPMSRHALKTALTEQRIVPFYQPLFSLRTRTVTGVEVLARHVNEAGRICGPAPLLDAANRHGMLSDVTFSLLNQTIADARQWTAAGLSLGVALNISPVMLKNLDLPDELARRFRQGGVDPKTVTLEITEDKLLDYEAGILDVLARFRIHGFKLSIDDFGTGATSIEQLRLYPFTELKIDRCFIQGAITDEFSRVTAETSARLAAMLGMTVVAEGVETEEQLKFARSIGVQTMQGFLLARPMSGNDLLDWMAEYEKTAVA